MATTVAPNTTNVARCRFNTQVSERPYAPLIRSNRLSSQRARRPSCSRGVCRRIRAHIIGVSVSDTTPTPGRHAHVTANSRNTARRVAQNSSGQTAMSDPWRMMVEPIALHPSEQPGGADHRLKLACYVLIITIASSRRTGRG